MPEYIVYKKEIYFCPVRVTADTATDAVAEAREGVGDEEATQYLDTDEDGWKIALAPQDGSLPDHENVTRYTEELTDGDTLEADLALETFQGEQGKGLRWKQ